MRRDTKNTYKVALEYLQNLQDISLEDTIIYTSNEIITHFYENLNSFNNITNKILYKEQTITAIKVSLLYDEMYGWNKEPLEPAWAVGETE